MIIGIGTDIIEINRIKKAIDKTPNFISRIFTEKEINMFMMKGMRAETIAGNFAAKEAVSKAMGTGVRGFTLKDLEILRDDLGKPVVHINEKVKAIINKANININVSISHNKTSAIALVVLEEK